MVVKPWAAVLGEGEACDVGAIGAERPRRLSVDLSSHGLVVRVEGGSTFEMWQAASSWCCKAGRTRRSPVCGHVSCFVMRTICLCKLVVFPAAAGEFDVRRRKVEEPMKRFAVLVVAALALSAGGCMGKPRHLVYPQGVAFVGWHVPNFEICIWDRDPNNPQPCPLVVHLPAGDLSDKELSDATAVKRAGWEEQNNGNLILRANKALVCCSHRGGALVGVSVSALPGNGGGPITFSVDGKRVSLPATDEAITTALGPPVRRD